MGIDTAVWSLVGYEVVRTIDPFTLARRCYNRGSLYTESNISEKK